MSFNTALIAGIIAVGCNAAVLACACAPPPPAGGSSGLSSSEREAVGTGSPEPSAASVPVEPLAAPSDSASPQILTSCQLADDPALALIQSRPSPTADRDAAVLRRAVFEDRTLSREKWVEGEDATSGFYTLVLSDGERRRFVRVVWNGGSQQLVSVTDYLFDRAGNLAHVEENLVAEQELKTVVSGAPPRRATRVASWQFREGRLSAWSELHVAPLVRCDEWLQKEAQLKAHAAVERS